MSSRIAAKKSLGQNWLVNRGVAERIVAAAELSPQDTVLEVGPGRGALTGLLATQAGTVVAVEKDSRLIGPLREQFASSPNVSVVEGDILRTDPHALGLQATSYKLIANLPYYITSRFLRLLLSWRPPPERAVIMVQKEVARRMMAAPPDMNLLALSVQAYAAAERVMDVSPGSFSPPPDVESSVVVIQPRAISPEERKRTEDALAVAKKSFGHRRKQLSSSVPGQVLTRCGIAPSARPQELDWKQWLCIAEPAKNT